MTPSPILPTNPELVEPVNTVDPDLAEQAVPGHGIPSHDPNASAQIALSPEEAERESKSAMIGGALVAGSAAGAAVGAAVGGPIGVLVGGTIGAVAGALGGAGAGELVHPDSTTASDEALKDAAEKQQIEPPR